MGAMAVGFIPLSEVLAYCALHEVDDPVELAAKVRACDVVWVGWMSDEAKRDRNQRQHERPRGD